MWDLLELSYEIKDNLGLGVACSCEVEVYEIVFFSFSSAWYVYLFCSKFRLSICISWFLRLLID